MRSALLVLSLAVIFGALPAPAAAARPNVLVVLVDDAGYGDYGCHGQPFMKTPNIDRLHDESVRFTDFHVAPMCTPTRGQLLTGLDALRNAACSVTAGRAILRPGVPTLPELLGQAGYRTGIFGKWHLGDNYPSRPMDKGFQEALWIKGWGFTSAPEFNNTHFDGRFYRGDREERYSGYVTDFFFNEAMKWMRDCQEKQAPFFCYLPLHAVHTPIVVEDRYAAPYEQVAKGAAKYFGMLANVDENVGRLEAFLQETKLRENTILLFMNDNGGTGGVRFYNAGLRGHKTEYYDGGHVSPLFVRWPAGGLRAAGEIAWPAQVQDVLPTLLELCGTPAPAKPVDGLSLAGLLRGQPAPPDRAFVVQYGASPEDASAPHKGTCAVVQNQWRLVNGRELYDIHADRAQEHNLAGEHADVVAEMQKFYDGWWARLEPTLADFVPISLGAPQENPVLLTSSDWQDRYADNSKHIRDGVGGPQGGPWNVKVEQAGSYEVVLRRWPFELETALSSAPPEGQAKAFPIASAKLTIAGAEYEVSCPSGALEARLTVPLPAGRTQLHAWFKDAAGNDLCGAYDAKVFRQ